MGLLSDIAAHWYEVVETDRLRQGDILQDLTLPFFPADLPSLNVAEQEHAEVGAAQPIQWKKGSWIILTASCDLESDVPFTLLAAVEPLEPRLENMKSRERRQMTETIRRGLMPSKFMLAPREETPELPISVVDFRTQLTIPTGFLRRACMGKRLRLRPPFREALGHWVGTNISRVGVEDDHQIPRDNAGVSHSLLLKMVETDEDGPPN